MFDEIAEYYDYFKQHRNYEREAMQLGSLILDKNSSAKHIVELGCGTGSLLKELHEISFSIAGVDESEEMLEVARQKLPSDTELYSAKFDNFELTRPADAVVWVDGAIGYVHPEKVEKTLGHIVNTGLKKDGILLIEPWYSNKNWQPELNHLVEHKTESGDIYIRLSHGKANGSMDFHHLIATKEGVKHISSTSRMWLHDYEKVYSDLKNLGLEVSEIKALPSFKRGLILAF